MASEATALNSLLILTKDGEWGTAGPLDDSVQMHVIRGTDFGAVRFGDLRKVPLRYVPRHLAERKRLAPGDILIETAGGTKDQPTGRTVLLKDKLFGQSSMPMTCASFARFLRVDSRRVIPEYLFWFLQALYRDGHMEAHQVQHTGVARFQYTNFAETIRVPLPALPEQRAIARILGALDDKIELNRKTNDTLESMARAVFKSWFVSFDAVRAKMAGEPGRTIPETFASVPDGFDEARSRDMPREWRADRFDSLFLVPLRNGLTRPKSVRGAGTHMVNMGELFAHPRLGDVPMDRVPFSQSEATRFLLEEGDLLFARQSLTLEGAGKCSLVAAASEPRTFESHLIRCRLDPKRASHYFYAHLFWSPEPDNDYETACS